MISQIAAINRSEALRYMGYNGEPDERISAQIGECEKALLKEARHSLCGGYLSLRGWRILWH